MVTKGIIKSIDLTGNTCTVHMPYFETAGNDPIIGTAIISNTPGSYNGYKVGDVVLVAFEDGGMDTPVVMGKLYLGAEAERADPRGVLNVETSTVSKSASMPADTKLANSMDANVPNTTAPYSSLSSIANELNTLNVDVRQMDRDTGNRFKQVISDIDGTKSELHQTADTLVAKVSGYKHKVDVNGEVILDELGNPVPELDKDGKPIPEGFGWDLQQNYWRVSDANRTILTVDSTGLHVIGKVDAELGHIGNFMIGNIGISSSTGDGDNEAAWIPNYATTPTTDTGVYVGTDGIRLGKNFDVDNSGNVTATSLTIKYKIDDNENSTIENALSDLNSKANAAAALAEVNANGYTDDAEARANEYAEGKADAARDAVYTRLDIKDTTITVDGIATPVVLADKLWVNSAKINGQLTAGQINTTGLQADKIEVVKGTGENAQNVLYANAADPDNVKLGNFIVDPNSISLPVTESGTQYKFGKNNTVMICTGSDGTANIGGSGNVDGWNFTAGKNFGVRTIKTGANAGESELYASKGKIGGFEIGTDKISSGTLGSTTGVILAHSDGFSGKIGDGYSDNWRFAVSNKFGIEANGDVYINGGSGTFDDLSVGACHLNDVRTFNFTGESFNVGGMTLSNFITDVDSASEEDVTFTINKSDGGATYETSGAIIYFLKVKANKVLAEKTTLSVKLKSGSFKGRYSSAYEVAKTITFNKDIVFPKGTKEVTISVTSGSHTQYGDKDTWVCQQGIFSNNRSSHTQKAKVASSANTSLLQCSGGFIPTVSEQGNLGTSSYRWGNIYGKDINSNGTITASGNLSAKNFTVTDGAVVAQGNLEAANLKTSGKVEFKNANNNTYYEPVIRLNADKSPNCFWSAQKDVSANDWASIDLPTDIQGKVVSAAVSAHYANNNQTNIRPGTNKDMSIYDCLAAVSNCWYVDFSSDSTKLWVYNGQQDPGTLNVLVAARI